MTPTDNEFYEAYKKSASFCDDLYQKEREKNYKSGIKYYIEDMEHTPFSVARMIPNWNSDLKKLKYLLYLRISSAMISIHLLVRSLPQMILCGFSPFISDY